MSCLAAARQPFDLRRMEDDLLKDKASSVADFDKLLTAFQKCRSDIARGIKLMKEAPGPLLMLLRTQYADDADGQLVMQLADQLDGYTAKLETGEPHLKAMEFLVRDMQEETAVACMTFEKRRDAWQPKVHYSQKVEQLKSYAPFAQNKLARNLHKSEESDEYFQRISADAECAAEKIASSRIAGTALALEELCRCHAEIFESVEGRTLADHFAQASIRAAPAGFIHSLRRTNSSSLTVGSLPMSRLGSLATLKEEEEEIPPCPPPEGTPPSDVSSGPKSPVSQEMTPRLLGRISLEDSRFFKMPFAKQDLETDATRMYKEHDKVDIWSNSAGQWLPAVVEKVYETACVVDGYNLPAGCLLVVFKGSMKYVRPEQIKTLLRSRDTVSAGLASESHLPQATLPETTQEDQVPQKTQKDFEKGDKVEVWSASQSAWLVATVEEIYADGCVQDGMSIPAGCIKVRSKAGIRFVQKSQHDELLRRQA